MQETWPILFLKNSDCQAFGMRLLCLSVMFGTSLDDAETKALRCWRSGIKDTILKVPDNGKHNESVTYLLISRWLRGLRRGSAAVRLLVLRVRILLGAGYFSLVSVVCCPVEIPRPEEYYRLCVCVCVSVIRCNNNHPHLQRVCRKRSNSKGKKSNAEIAISSHLFFATYEDGTECSETSAHKIHSPGSHQKERIQYSEHDESLKPTRVLHFRRPLYNVYKFCN